MAVYVNNITVACGSSFSQDLYLDNNDGTSVNLAGYGISSYIRKHPSSSTKAAEFIVKFIDTANGHFNLSLDAATSAGIKPGRYVYDVLTTVGVGTANVKRIVIEGNVLATDEISVC